MIRVKIFESVHYSFFTFVREFLSILRICWIYILAIVTVQYVTLYVWKLLHEIDVEILKFFFQNTTGLLTYNNQAQYPITTACFELLLTSIIAVALLRLFIIEDRSGFQTHTIRIERVYSEISFSIPYYFRFHIHEVGYFVLSLFTYFITITLMYVIQNSFWTEILAASYYEDNSSIMKSYSLFSHYGYAFLTAFMYSLFSIYFAHIAIRGFPKFGELFLPFKKLWGNYIRVYIVIFYYFPAV